MTCSWRRTSLRARPTARSPSCDLEEPEPDVVAPEPAVDAPELKIADGALSETTPVEAATDTEPRLDLEPAPFPASRPTRCGFSWRASPPPSARSPLGTPDGGLLFNPLPFPEGDLWTVREPAESFATAETIVFITTAIETVESPLPGLPSPGDRRHQPAGRRAPGPAPFASGGT